MQLAFELHSDILFWSFLPSKEGLIVSIMLPMLISMCFLKISSTAETQSGATDKTKVDTGSH